MNFNVSLNKDHVYKRVIVGVKHEFFSLCLKEFDVFRRVTILGFRATFDVRADLRTPLPLSMLSPSRYPFV